MSAPVRSAKRSNCSVSAMGSSIHLRSWSQIRQLGKARAPVEGRAIHFLDQAGEAAGRDAGSTMSDYPCRGRGPRLPAWRARRAVIRA